MDTNSVLLIAGICVVIGFLIGGLVSGLGSKPDLDKGRKPLLKVWRDPKKENLIVEVDGAEFDHSVRLNARQRSHLGQIILELNAWLDAQMTPHKASGDLRLPEDSNPEPEADEAPRPRLIVNPVNVLSNALKADVPKSQLPTESIVSQIDYILQEMLQDSPLQGEGVRLMEKPGQGTVVMIGLEKFSDVDDVPNDAIREMIHAAVREWEQQSMGDE